MSKVLISGGSRGIGASLVRKYASLGDDIAFIYRNDDEGARKLSIETGSYYIKADLSESLSAVSAFNTAMSLLDGLDILVCNAGISYVNQICDTSDSDWKRIIDTNLSQVFYLTREASKTMVRNHSGKIIVVGSVWGKCGASCEAAYSASKAALRGLTMSLAKELGPSGITVNCVEPGIIDTDMNRCFTADEISAVCEEIPVGRMGKPSEVAELIAFLSSDKASYINGQCIAVDGGWCI